MAAVATLDDLDRLEKLYAQGFHDSFLDRGLRKLIERQIARDEADLERVKNALAQLERQYNLSSEEFWTRFQAGTMPDTMDNMEWNILCKMRARLVTRLDILRRDGAHESDR